MMEIEQAIRDMLCRVYQREYIGKLKVEETFSKFPGEPDEHAGWKLSIMLNKDERPLTIAVLGSEEDFLKLIEKELHDRSLVSVEYFSAIRLYPYEEKK